MKYITIYTDGACSGNPGPGGWAAVLIYNDNIKEISGAEANTTNNRMELCAVMNALSALKQPCRIALYTDSAYICNAFDKGWLNNWTHNGWHTANKKPVENQDLWKAILSLANDHQVEWKKVKGHSGDKYNERCDDLARKAIQTLKA